MKSFDLLFVVAISTIWALHVHATSHGECSPNGVSAARRSFAYEFYDQIRKETEAGKNIMLAPTTLGSALSMVLVGSGGRTREQIMSTMFQNMTDKDTLDCLVEAYADPFLINNAQDEARESKSGLTLRTASKLYGEKAYRFNENFIGETRRYGMEMEEVDFAMTTGPVREYINQWVSDATDGHIKDFFKPTDITSQTALAIVSAIYFEGTWKDTFRKESTLALEFEIREGETIQVDFMRRNGRYKTHFSETLDADMLEMPYREDDLFDVSMILIKPETSIERTEGSLNEKNLAEALSKLFNAFPFQTRLAVPKFNVSAEYKLGPVLAGMGMTDLLTPGLANLQPMLSPKNTAGAPLYVETAVHKTMLKVDEEGTVGAGVTGISVVPLSLPPPFTCNRPFLLLVYEKTTQNIIFIGRIVDPTADSS